HSYILSFPTRRSSDLSALGRCLADSPPGYEQLLVPVHVSGAGTKQSTGAGLRDHAGGRNGIRSRKTGVCGASALFRWLFPGSMRSEEHTSELQSRENL